MNGLSNNGYNNSQSCIPSVWHVSAAKSTEYNSCIAAEPPRGSLPSSMSLQYTVLITYKNAIQTCTKSRSFNALPRFADGHI